MKTLHNEIIITRGETFTMDKIFENKDGSPYIISNQHTNPQWLITISSSEFEQPQKIIKQWKLSLERQPRFECTNAIPLTEIFPGMTSFDSITTAATYAGPKVLKALTIDGEQVLIEATDYVFYLDTDEGRQYKYATIADDGKIIWHTYECRLTKPFTSEETKDLSSQNYMYSISLIDCDAKGNVKRDMYKPILLPTRLTIRNKLEGEKI